MALKSADYHRYARECLQAAALISKEGCPKEREALLNAAKEFTLYAVHMENDEARCPDPAERAPSAVSSSESSS
jgi:hypothetical protein